MIEAPAKAGKPPGEAASGGGGSRAPFGAADWGRWAWRQLTSMRTALVLLFLLAVGTVPGSMLPQQGADPAGVQQYFSSHPGLAPWLNRLGLFNVFAAPWFAAIYLLLFTSLVGCVVPRTFKLVGSARSQPPRAPRNLRRLPRSAEHPTTLTQQAAVETARDLLGGKGFRLRSEDNWVAAEKGYLREVGNLLFHLALLGVLISIAIGGLFGYKADKLLVEGQSFSDTTSALDEFHPGRLVSSSDLAPFTLTLDKFNATYLTSGVQRGQPNSFVANVSYAAHFGDPQRQYAIRVNHPLAVDNTNVYLIGHGYAPVFKVTDAHGNVVFSGATPFIADNSGTELSQGVLKVPDAQPDQLGFAAVFVPTAVSVNGTLESAFPAAYNPAVSLIGYAGNLGLNSGVPQSVYQLDTKGMHRITSRPQLLQPGQSFKLPGGRGTITFTGFRQWVSLAITYDPGQLPALICGIAALCGLLLSFMVRRRRIFVRVTPDNVVQVGGLARSDASGGFEAEFASLAAELKSAHQPAENQQRTEA